MKKIIEYLRTRIAELQAADAAFCNKRWDMTKPEFERKLYREQSNQVTFGRQELQQLLKFAEALEKETEPVTLIPSDQEIKANAEAYGEKFNDDPHAIAPEAFTAGAVWMRRKFVSCDYSLHNHQVKAIGKCKKCDGTVELTQARFINQ
jgi:hypothetical protein